MSFRDRNCYNASDSFSRFWRYINLYVCICICILVKVLVEFASEWANSCSKLRFLQTTVGLPLSDHSISKAICQHPSLYVRTVQGQMYCIFTKYTAADQTLKFGGDHTFLGGFTGRKKFGYCGYLTHRVYGRQIFPMFWTPIAADMPIY